MASYWCDEGVEEIAKKSVDWVNDTIKARLVESLPARTATSMTGVTGVGDDQVLGTKSLVKDETTHKIKFVAANPTFPSVSSGSTIVGVVVYKFVTDDAGSLPLLVHAAPGIETDGTSILVDWPTIDGTDGTVGYTKHGTD